MILYPAIDLKDGQCVRVLHGDLDTATVFNNSPADQARQFVNSGFHWIHVIDLNGAVKFTLDGMTGDDLSWQAIRSGG